MADTPKPAGVVGEVVEQLSGIFRYMLPGILVMGMAYLAYPKWFEKVDLTATSHLLVLGVLTIAVGNAWFVLNRYGVHQFTDYLLYQFKFEGPIRDGKQSYRQVIAQRTCESLRLDPSFQRIQQHVALRASTTLLLLTIGELAFIFGGCHPETESSHLTGYRWYLIPAGLFVFALGVWQMVLTRSIDDRVVALGKTEAEAKARVPGTANDP